MTIFLSTLIHIPSIAQIVDDWGSVDLSVNNSSPVVNCSAVKLTFDLTNIEDEPLSNLTLRLFLRDDLGFTFVENPGFTIGATGVIIGTSTYTRFDLPGITIPGLNDPEQGMLQICAWIRQTIGNANEGVPAVLMQTVVGSLISSVVSGPGIVNDPSFIEVGSLPTDITYLSEIATGQTGDLLTPGNSQNAGQSVLITGALLVDVDYHFPGSSDLYLQDGAGIQVLNGSSLTFQDAAQLRGCSESWRGIEVLNGGSLTVDGDTDQSSFTTVTIQDADAAITARDGATINISNSSLINNQTGILIPSNAVPNAVNHTIYNNLFASDINNLSAGQSVAISANDLLYPLVLQENTYRDLSKGIVGKNASFVSDQELFESLETGIEMKSKGSHFLIQTGNGVDESEPTFTNCEVAVEARNVNVTSTQNAILQTTIAYSLKNGLFKNVDIRDNLIRAERFGVAFNQWRPLSQIEVVNNDIYIDGDLQIGAGILSEMLYGGLFEDNRIHVGDGRRGIYLLSCERIRVTGNIVEIEESVHPAYEGIRLDGCRASIITCNSTVGSNSEEMDHVGINLNQSPFNHLGCNTLDNTGIGMLILGSNNLTRLRGNRFNNHSHGLQIGHQNILPSGIIGQQEHRGNQWFGSFEGNDYGAVHYGGLSEIEESKFLVNTNDGNELISTENAPNAVGAKIFQDIQGNTSICVESSCPLYSTDLPETLSTTDGKIAEGLINFNIFNDEQLWTIKRQLYWHLLETPNLLQNNTLANNFVNEEANMTIGMFEMLYADIAALYDMNEQAVSQISTNVVEIQVKMNKLSEIVTAIREVTNTQEQVFLQSEMSALRNEISQLSEEYKLLLEALKSDMNSNGEILLEFNSNITVNTSQELYQKELNNILLESVLPNVDELTNEELNLLQNIAIQCPYKGGDAVYQARALIGGGNIYDDASACSTVQPLIKRKDLNESFELIVFPNPASDYLTIKLNDRLEEDGSISLSNSIGMILNQKQVESGEDTILLLIEDLPAGMYYLTIDNGTDSITRKVNIQN